MTHDPGIGLSRWLRAALVAGAGVLCTTLAAEADAAPCGGAGQRACCVGEQSFGACKSGHVEKSGCSLGAANCKCGGSIFQASSHCEVKPADTPCGDAGQRACCVAEKSFGACKDGRIEVSGCPYGAAKCKCGEGSIFLASSRCEVAPCGGVGQRACCVLEAGFGACKDGLVEISGCPYGASKCTCGNSFVPASSRCEQKAACGGPGQRACCVGEEPFGPCKLGAVEVLGCPYGAVGCHCGSSMLSAVSRCVSECSASASWAEKAATANCGKYKLGTAMRDITGPVAETQMQGYASSDQTSKGLHMRLWARAFVVEGCNGKRVAFVSADLAQMFHSVRQGVIERLKKKLGSRYSYENVMISATHTHQAVAGYSHYMLMNMSGVTNFDYHGFDKENYDIIVDGIAGAIEAADAEADATTGTIQMGSGVVKEASFNRSEAAYANNPAGEHGDPKVDRLMTQLRFDSADARPLGLLNWVAVHNTAMSKENQLVSGDAKGIAGYWFERDKGVTEWGPAAGFVAAFAQSNCGDSSPNAAGTPDAKSDEDGRVVTIADRQYQVAKALYDSPSGSLQGGVEYHNVFVDFEDIAVAPAYSGSLLTGTCRADYGIAFMGGSKEDGVGTPIKEGNGVWWAVLAPLNLATPSGAVAQACHEVKPLSPVPLGVRLGVHWSPVALPLQIMVIGQLAIVGVPFELTTVTGRRLRSAVLGTLGPRVKTVVIAGLANDYGGYVATREEYAKQHYEGASTQFGPWTETALRQEMVAVACGVKGGDLHHARPWREVTPPDLTTKRLQIPPLPPPLLAVVAPLIKLSQNPPARSVPALDQPPAKGAFGQLKEDAKATYAKDEPVTIKFWGGHPRRSAGKLASFFRIERKVGEAWELVATDNSPDTRYEWERQANASLLTVRWQATKTAGTYRVRYFGHAKTGAGLKTYEGQSRSFSVP